MSEETLKFGDIVVNKNYFHGSKEAIALYLMGKNRILASDKSQHRDDGSTFFIGY